MANLMGSITRGVVGGFAAVLLVGVALGFRTWWGTVNSAAGGVDIGPILRPEYGVGGLVAFFIGFLIAWK